MTADNRATKGNLRIYHIDSTAIVKDTEDEINQGSDELILFDTNTNKLEDNDRSTSWRTVPEQADTTSKASGINIDETGTQDTNGAITDSDNHACTDYENSSDDTLDNKSRQYVQVNTIHGDITKTKADVIIVPGNERLSPSGGVTKAVFDAAGSELVANIRKATKGKTLKIGDVLFTSCGALKGNISQIVHIVIPAGKSLEHRTGKTTCVYSLISALCDCLKQCADKSITKIALPAIGTGYSGIPHKLCSFVYLFALNKLDEYCKSKKGTELKIDFVDISTDTLDNISKEFGVITKNDFHNLDDYIDEELDKLFPVKTYHTGGINGIKVFQGNITLFLGCSIVCAVNKDLNPCGRVASSIFKQAGKQFQNELVSHKERTKIKTGDVIVTGPWSLYCSHIFSCVMPKNRFLFKRRDNKEKLIKCYQNVFLRASEKGIPRMTLYVLGADTNYLEMDLCCAAMVDSLESQCNSWDGNHSLTMLHITCAETTLLDCLQNHMERLFRNS